MTCNADTISKDLLNNLTAGIDFSLPDLDFSDGSWDLPDSLNQALQAQTTTISIDDLTVKQIDGTGAMDVILKSAAVHLREEFDKNRITGAEYTKAYIALVTAAMQTGLQFVLQKDAAKWAAITAQVQALTAKVNLETVKAAYIQQKATALNAKAAYAVTTMQLAQSDAQYCLLGSQKDQVEAQTQLTTQQRQNLIAEAQNIPKQGQVLEAQKSQITQQTENLAAEELNIPKQGLLLTQQTATQKAQEDTIKYTLANMLPEQVKHQKEQTEAARAQTLDTRADGASVAGSIGKQKDLYSQQITSYQRSSEINAAQMFKDAWIAHKSIDEGIDTPPSFNATSISEVLASIKTKNSL